MGFREQAYLRYLGGKGTTLTGADVPQDMIPAFQELAGIGYKKPKDIRGQITYDDYKTTTNPGVGELKATIGRTGVGQIYRDGNYWRVKDTYDFNPVEGGVMGDIKMGVKALQQGDMVTALGRASRYVGKPYNMDVTVPMSPEQIQAFGSQMTHKPDDITFGGQKYNWAAHTVGEGETANALAQKYFAGNQYKPEGDNLTKMSNMIAQTNLGSVKAGDKVWVPVNGTKVAQVPQNALPSQLPADSTVSGGNPITGAIDLLNHHLGGIMDKFRFA